jgi:ATP-dependent HslUV protease, peptidase subunit HslV
LTTVCVVRKGGQLAIAADSLVTFGDTRLPHGYESNHKLFKVGSSYFGMSGTTAHFPVLRPRTMSSSARATRSSTPSSSCTRS